MDYISQHVRQAYAKEQEGKAYRLYIAETLRCISESSAQKGGPYVTAKWADIIDPQPEDTRKPEDVKKHMLEKLQAMGGEG